MARLRQLRNSTSNIFYARSCVNYPIFWKSQIDLVKSGSCQSVAIMLANLIVEDIKNMHEILGFIWPIMAASAEGMIFFWMIVILVIIGRGKILPSEQAIIIDRKARYKMELAPGLNLAQSFIEAIAEQVILIEDVKHNEFILNFEVQDKNIASRKRPFYLLQIAMKNGYLSFDAKPVLQNNILPKISSFVDNDRTMMDDIENEIRAVAKSWKICLHRVG